MLHSRKVGTARPGCWWLSWLEWGWTRQWRVPSSSSVPTCAQHKQDWQSWTRTRFLGQNSPWVHMQGAAMGRLEGYVLLLLCTSFLPGAQVEAALVALEISQGAWNTVTHLHGHCSSLHSTARGLTCGETKGQEGSGASGHLWIHQLWWYQGYMAEAPDHPSGHAVGWPPRAHLGYKTRQKLQQAHAALYSTGENYYAGSGKATSDSHLLLIKTLQLSV